MFKFMLGKIAKMVSRSVNSAFFITLYKEIYKEIYDITGDASEASKIMKDLGIAGTLESSQRQESIFKVFPEDPKKILELLPTMIYQVIFGAKMDDYEEYEEKIENSDYPAVVFRLNKSSICGGFNDGKESPIDFSGLAPEESKCAAGVVGMMQEVANYILMTKGNPYRINIIERKCFNAGDDCMELFCSVLPLEQFGLVTEEEAEKIKQKDNFNLDLDKIEEILTKPMNVVKEELTKIIREKMNMTPDDLFDHFRNYEDDMVRIFGFLLIHLVNEPGRLIEKIVENETGSKIVGHGYNTMVEMTKIYIPMDVVEDYQKLLIEFLTDLAPDEMINSFKKIEPSDFIMLFYEGIKKAFKDLGVNFEGLKSNIWEEIELSKVTDAIPVGQPDESTTEDEKRKLSEIKMKIIQESFLLISALLSLPTQILISTTHSTVKSVASSGGSVFSNVRDHTERIFDLAEQLK